MSANKNTPTTLPDFPMLPHAHTLFYQQVPRRKLYGLKVNGTVSDVSVSYTSGSGPSKESKCVTVKYLPDTGLTTISFRPPVPGEYVITYTTRGTRKTFELAVEE